MTFAEVITQRSVTLTGSEHIALRTYGLVKVHSFGGRVHFIVEHRLQSHETLPVQSTLWQDVLGCSIP